MSHSNAPTGKHTLKWWEAGYEDGFVHGEVKTAEEMIVRLCESLQRRDEQVSEDLTKARDTLLQRVGELEKYKAEFENSKRQHEHIKYQHERRIAAMEKKATEQITAMEKKATEKIAEYSKWAKSCKARADEVETELNKFCSATEVSMKAVIAVSSSVLRESRPAEDEDTEVDEGRVVKEEANCDEANPAKRQHMAVGDEKMMNDRQKYQITLCYFLTLWYGGGVSTTGYGGETLLPEPSPGLSLLIVRIWFEIKN
jgi:hypothetical protein